MISLVKIIAILSITAAVLIVSSKIQTHIFARFKNIHIRTGRIFNRITRLKNTRQIETKMVDALEAIQSGLRAGYSLEQSFKISAEETEGLMGRELKLIYDQTIRCGSFDEALEGFAGRYESSDIGVFVESIIMLKRCGGNIIEMAENFRATLIERQKITNKIGLLVSQGRIQMIVLAFLPWMLALALYVVSPEYIGILFSTRLGQILISITIALEIIGIMWMKKIIDIEV